MIPFTETSVSRRIHNTVSMAQKMNTNAAIIGAPGVGKTRSLEEYAHLNGNIIFLTMTPVLGGSLRNLIEEVSKPFGLNGSGRSIYEMERTIINTDFRDWTFIIDEAQNLTLKAIRQLLHFSPEDKGTMKFIFCGNSEVLKRVNTDKGAFAQISRRVGFREIIDAISETDADVLINSFGVEGLDAYRLMRIVGKQFHADGIVRVLESAKAVAGRGTIQVPHIEAAFSVLEQFRPTSETSHKRLHAS